MTGLLTTLRVAWIIARMLAALPVRGLAWAFFLTGFAGSRVARLFGWIADLIEGV